MGGGIIGIRLLIKAKGVRLKALGKGAGLGESGALS